MKQMPVLIGVMVAFLFLCQTSLVAHGATPDCFFAFSAMSAGELSGNVADGSSAVIHLRSRHVPLWILASLFRVVP